MKKRLKVITAFLLMIVMAASGTCVFAGTDVQPAGDEPQAAVEVVGEGEAPVDAVAIPENVTSIGENAFYDCKLTSLEVAPGNTVYHSYGNCLIDTEEKQILKAAVPFTIPSDGSVTSFARYAVSSYYGESLTLPKYITDLGFNSFPYVKNVYYDGTPEEYRAIERMSDTIKLGKAIVHFTSFAEPQMK